MNCGTHDSTMTKILFSFGTFLLTTIANGQNDPILKGIKDQLPSNWELTLNETSLVISSSDSIGTLAYKPNLYEKESAISEPIELSKTATITYKLFDILDYDKLDYVLNQIEHLKSIVNKSFERCYVDLCDLTFVQNKTLRGDKRATRRNDKKAKKRKLKCEEYDKAEVELRQLLDRTPIYFTENYALGTPHFNWEDELCENWIVRIWPSKLDNEIQTVVKVLNDILKTRPNKRYE